MELMPIPSDIKPQMVSYRIDIAFWGVRNLKQVQMFAIKRPKIVIECCGTIVHSDTLTDIERTLNFSTVYKYMDLVSFSKM